jgi:multimeric flavodoxin WrbA
MRRRELIGALVGVLAARHSGARLVTVTLNPCAGCFKCRAKAGDIIPDLGDALPPIEFPACAEMAG